MRYCLSAIAFSAVTVACGGGLEPNAPILAGFSYTETPAGAGEVPYDSVATAARNILVAHKATGNLCGSRLTAGVTSSASEVRLNVFQSPIATCSSAAKIVSYSGTIQINAGTYHLVVVETNGGFPQGKVVIDQTVVVPATD